MGFFEIPAKRCKVVGSASVGTRMLFTTNKYDRMIFHYYDFAQLLPGKCVTTNTIKAHGRRWKLQFSLPDGTHSRPDDTVDVQLVCIGVPCKIPTVVKGFFETTSYPSKNMCRRYEISRFTCSEKDAYTNINVYRFINKDKSYRFLDKNDVIANNCDDEGTFTIAVCLQLATEATAKKSTWFPQVTSSDYSQLYNSNEVSDVTFMVGNKEFHLHKCVLLNRAKDFYELVRIAETSISSSNNNNNNNNNKSVVILENIEEQTFLYLVRFIYDSKELPSDLFRRITKKEYERDEKCARLILVASNKYRLTELKLYVESLLTEKCLVPARAASFLIFADAYTCALLKEQSMEAFKTHPIDVMRSIDDYKKVTESDKLLEEIIEHGSKNDDYDDAGFPSIRSLRYRAITVSRREYFIGNIHAHDVTSLREHLTLAELNVDGSQSILVQRWKKYLQQIPIRDGGLTESDSGHDSPYFHIDLIDSDTSDTSYDEYS